MTEASLDFQKHVRSALTSYLPLIPLVSPNAIFDRIGTPERFPCVLIGESFSEFPDDFSAFFSNITMDLHIWSSATSTAEVKAISHEIRKALMSTPVVMDGNEIVDLQVPSARFLRDPDGIHHHGILTVTAIVRELC
jgi:hypothetical protein